MARLDATDSIGFEAFGVRLAVAVPDALAGQLDPALPPRRTACEADGAEVTFELVEDGGGVAVFRDGDPFTEPVPAGTALEVLERELRTEVALRAPELIFVHAGVVAHGGRGLLLPGRSHAGKSTLVAALVRAGATYYSDEYAVLDQQGRVHPYARRLSIRGENGVPRLHDAADLGGTAGERPVPVAAVAFATFREGSVWDPAPMSSGEAVLALVENTVPARTRPQESLHAATRAVEGALLRRGERGDADRTATLLLDAVCES